jgi:hypothetical protein
MGRGFVRADHGRMPNPPPAVVEVLSGCPTYAVDLDVELVTPTGAAIVATLARDFVRWPTFRPMRVGYGAGQRELSDRPNLLRAVLGEQAASRGHSHEEGASHVVLEANVDDMTGELAGHALAVMLEEGALDAWAAPITMKKGRPGLVLSVLASLEQSDRLGAALLRETTSIGLRRRAVSRIERPRRTTTVATRFGEVACKVSEGAYGGPLIKPEFDECAKLARAAGVPVREVIAAAIAASAASNG